MMQYGNKLLLFCFLFCVYGVFKIFQFSYTFKIFSLVTIFAIFYMLSYFRNVILTLECIYTTIHHNTVPKYTNFNLILISFSLTSHSSLTLVSRSHSSLSLLSHYSFSISFSINVRSAPSSTYALPLSHVLTRLSRLLTDHRSLTVTHGFFFTHGKHSFFKNYQLGLL
jgi:hypothetical protein